MNRRNILSWLIYCAVVLSCAQGHGRTHSTASETIVCDHVKITRHRLLQVTEHGDTVFYYYEVKAINRKHDNGEIVVYATPHLITQKPSMHQSTERGAIRFFNGDKSIAILPKTFQFLDGCNIDNVF